MSEGVPICHCIEYYGSHPSDCPVAAEIERLRARVVEVESERDDARSDASRLGDALFDLVETKDANVRLRARVAELEKDRERLRFWKRSVQSNPRKSVQGACHIASELERKKFDTARASSIEATDAAKGDG